MVIRPNSPPGVCLRRNAWRGNHTRDARSTPRGTAIPQGRPAFRWRRTKGPYRTNQPSRRALRTRSSRPPTAQSTGRAILSPSSLFLLERTAHLKDGPSPETAQKLPLLIADLVPAAEGSENPGPTRCAKAIWKPSRRFPAIRRPTGKKRAHSPFLAEIERARRLRLRRTPGAFDPFLQPARGRFCFFPETTRTRSERALPVQPAPWNLRAFLPARRTAHPPIKSRVLRMAAASRADRQLRSDRSWDLVRARSNCGAIPAPTTGTRPLFTTHVTRRRPGPQYQRRAKLLLEPNRERRGHTVRGGGLPGVRTWGSGESRMGGRNRKR